MLSADEAMRIRDEAIETEKERQMIDVDKHIKGLMKDIGVRCVQGNDFHVLHRSLYGWLDAFHTRINIFRKLRSFGYRCGYCREIGEYIVEWGENGLLPAPSTTEGVSSDRD